MKNYYEELSELISNAVRLDEAGELIFGNIIGAMKRAENEEAFEAYKDLAETAAVGLLGNNIITEAEHVKLLELIDDCCFGEGHSIKTHQVNMEEANKILIGMVLYGIFPLYNEENKDEVIGKSLIFHSNEKENVSRFRTLVIYDDGDVFISEEY